MYNNYMHVPAIIMSFITYIYIYIDLNLCGVERTIENTYYLNELTVNACFWIT